MSEVRNTLNERGGRYGRFDKHAGLADRLIRIAQFECTDLAVLGKERTGWLRLAPDQRHSIRYILDKIARILEGDPNYNDNWHDIAGYATLIEDRLNGTGLYAPEPRHVQLADCFGTGSLVSTDAAKSARCRNCHALVGDVHAPDCKEGQDASPAG